MYLYRDTKILSNIFHKVIIAILVVGFIGGIFGGIALREPTEEALEAMEEITYDISRGYPVYPSDREAAAEVEWTFNCTLAMLGIWAGSALAALLLYARKHEIEMMDAVCESLEKIESRPVATTANTEEETEN